MLFLDAQDANFAPGTKVMLIGLSSARGEELNGTRGVLKTFSKKKERWGVQRLHADTGATTDEFLSIKPKNLILVTSFCCVSLLLTLCTFNETFLGSRFCFFAKLCFYFLKAYCNPFKILRTNRHSLLYIGNTTWRASQKVFCLRSLWVALSTTL